MNDKLIKTIIGALHNAAYEFDQEMIKNIICDFPLSNKPCKIIEKGCSAFENLEEDILLTIFRKNIKIEDAAKIIADNIYNDRVYVMIIVPSITMYNEMNCKESIDRLKRSIKHEIPKKKINFTFSVSFFNSSPKNKYEILISNRVDSVTNECKGLGKGYVFSANLYSLVSMYNDIGDSLFDKNVRYGIGEELDVNKEIKRTLIENPEMFWFYNNGVTILIDDPTFCLSDPRKIKLNNKKLLSVINGAQTITTAAKFFNTEDNTLEAKDKANVLLRIININNSINEIADNISIALNRQKSIQKEDISFTFEFTKKLNKYSMEAPENIGFELYKRGGSSFCLYNYALTDFVKIVKCYLDQKPGLARNSTKSLLQCKFDESNNTYQFVDTKIFININSHEEFIKYYSPVNFANELYKRFESSVKKIDLSLLDENEQAVTKYGSWFFVAFCILCLNNYTHTDFSNFKYTVNNLKNAKLDSVVKNFIKEFAHIEEKALDSNDFKKEDIYLKLITKEKTTNNIKTELENQLVTEVNLFSKDTITV